MTRHRREKNSILQNIPAGELPGIRLVNRFNVVPNFSGRCNASLAPFGLLRKLNNPPVHGGFRPDSPLAQNMRRVFEFEVRQWLPRRLTTIIPSPRHMCPGLLVRTSTPDGCRTARRCLQASCFGVRFNGKATLIDSDAATLAKFPVPG